jgi:hypothetical protein
MAIANAVALVAAFVGCLGQRNHQVIGPAIAPPPPDFIMPPAISPPPSDFIPHIVPVGFDSKQIVPPSDIIPHIVPVGFDPNRIVPPPPPVKDPLKN